MSCVVALDEPVLHIKIDLSFCSGKLRDLEIESKVRVTSAITALLLVSFAFLSFPRRTLKLSCSFITQGPLDVGNQCLATPGVVEMMLAMAGSEDEVQQVTRTEPQSHDLVAV